MKRVYHLPLISTNYQVLFSSNNEFDEPTSSWAFGEGGAAVTATLRAVPTCVYPGEADIVTRC
jgi:hypothetical protein